MPANSARHRVNTLPLAKVRLVHVLTKDRSVK